MINPSQNTKRTFIALTFPVSELILNVYAAIRKEIAGVNIKWVENQNLHLTLAFLGDTTEKQVEQVKDGLEGIVAKYLPFEIRLNGLGVFKNLTNPQVLWVGIAAEQSLGFICRDIHHLVETVGFEKDTRPFKPHLTIGRIKSLAPANNLKEIISKYSCEINKTVTSKSIVYYESILRPAGPEYRAIKVFNR